MVSDRGIERNILRPLNCQFEEQKVSAYMNQSVTGKIKADFLVFEVDEGYVPVVFKDLYRAHAKPRAWLFSEKWSPFFRSGS